MQGMTAEEVAKILSGTGRQRARRSGKGWKVCCPAHDDRTPSLSLDDGENGILLYHCFGGCSSQMVRDALKQRLAGITPEKRSNNLPRTKVEDPIEVMVPVPDEAYVRAEDFIHHNYGSPNHIWEYHTRDGKIAGWIVRYNQPNGGKEIVPYVWTRDRQNGREAIKPRAMPEPRPLYRLHELLKNDQAPVLLVEGEKTSEAAAKLFPNWQVTTIAGGSSSIRKTDLTPLHGRKLILFSDHDQPGYNMIGTIAHALADHSEIYILMWPKKWPSQINNGAEYHLDKGADADDHYNAGWREEHLRQAVSEGHKLTHRLVDLPAELNVRVYGYEDEKRIKNAGQ